MPKQFLSVDKWTLNLARALCTLLCMHMYSHKSNESIARVSTVEPLLMVTPDEGPPSL